MKPKLGIRSKNRKAQAQFSSRAEAASPSPPRSGGEGRSVEVLRVQGENSFDVGRSMFDVRCSQVHEKVKPRLMTQREIVPCQGRLPSIAVELGNLLFDRNRTVLSPDEIAGKLSCSKPLVIKLIECGQLGAINIGTGKVKFYRVPAAEWEKFLRNRAAV